MNIILSRTWKHAYTEVGQTDGNLSSCVREHQRAIKLHSVENSILAEITWV